jgi:hypothetical protein
MCGRDDNLTSLPEPSSPIDERFVYRLTTEGKKAPEECERSNGKAASSKARCTSEVADALDSESGPKATASAQNEPGNEVRGSAPSAADGETGNGSPSCE